MQEHAARARIERRLERWFLYLSLVSIWFLSLLLIIDPVPIKYILRFGIGIWFLAVVRVICTGRS